MPTAKRTRTEISTRFSEAEDYVAEMTAGEHAVQSIIEDEFKHIHEMAVLSAQALAAQSAPNTFDIHHLDALSAQLLNPATAVQELDLTQLLYFICIAETLCEIRCANTKKRLEIISDYMLDCTLTFTDDVRMLIRRYLTVQEESLRRAEEDVIIQMDFDKRQKYILNSTNINIPFAKRIQEAVVADRSEFHFEGTFAEYLAHHQDVQSRLTALQFDETFCINNDRLQRIFERCIKNLKDNISDFIYRSQTDSDIIGLVASLQSFGKQVFALYKLGLQRQIPPLHTLAITEQLNHLLAISLNIISNTFHPVKSYNIGGHLIFTRPKPAFDVHALGKAMHNVVIGTLYKGPLVGEDGVEIFPYQVFINAIANFTNLADLLFDKICKSRAVMLDNNKLVPVIKTFFTHYVTVINSCIFVDSQPLLLYFNSIMLDIFTQLVPKISYKDLSDVELLDFIKLLNMAEILLHGEQLQTFLKTKLILEKIYVDRIITPIQIQDPNRVENLDEPIPMITVDRLQDFIKQKAKEYTQLIGYAGEASKADIETFPEVTGALKDGRSAQDVNAFEKYYESILDYAETQFLPATPKFTL